MEQVFEVRPGLIDRIRRYSGLVSDTAIADAMNTPLKQFKNIESGESAPTTEFLIGMYRAFGFTPGEVIHVASRAEPQQVA